MLHDCQGCHEQWSGDYLRKYPGRFEVEEETKAVKSCPHCRIVDNGEPIYTKEGKTSA